MRPPVTDPHQLLVIASMRSGLAHSALPDAPVLPFVEPRRVRVRRVLRRLAVLPATRRRPTVVHRPAGAASCS